MSLPEDKTPLRNTRSSKITKKPPGTRCGNEQCNKLIDVGKPKEVLQCERCKDMFHLECTGMNITALNFIIENNCLDNFIKCCLPCQPKARNEIGSIKQIKK